MEDRNVGGVRLISYYLPLERKLYSIFSDTGQLLGWCQASKFSRDAIFGNFELFFCI